MHTTVFRLICSTDSSWLWRCYNIQFQFFCYYFLVFNFTQYDLNIFFYLLSYQCILPYRYFESSSLISKVLLACFLHPLKLRCRKSLSSAMVSFKFSPTCRSDRNMVFLYLQNNPSIPIFILSTTYKYRTYIKKFRLEYPTVSNSKHECGQ